MNGMFNKAKWHLVIAFLGIMASSMSANAQQLIASKKVNPRDGTLAVRNKITAGGSVNLLEGYNARERGKNDFDGNKLTSNRNFVIDGLTINYGLALTADNVGVESVDYVTALPASLKSANLVIKQNDDVLRRISISAINKAKSTDEGWYFLEGFALLLEDQVTSVEIEFAQGTNLGALATQTSYAEVIFKGFETNVKA